METENVFTVEPISHTRIKGFAVYCNLPLIELVGEETGALADELAKALNETFHKLYPKMVDGVKEAEKQHAYWAKRNHSDHMYLAVLAVLRFQKNNNLGPVNWEEIYHHDDFNFIHVIGSALSGDRVKLSRVRRSIQASVNYLKSRGVDIEAVIIPGRGMCYSLC